MGKIGNKNWILIILIAIVLIAIVLIVNIFAIYLIVPKEKLTSNKDLNKIANPAAVFCYDNGYKYEIRAKETGDQYGICIFPDKSECDAWEYFCNCGYDARYCKVKTNKCNSKCD